MKRYVILLTILLALAACKPGQPPIKPTAMPTQTAALPTTTSTLTNTPTPTATPLTARVRDDAPFDAGIFAGPSDQTAEVGTVRRGETAIVLGRLWATDPARRRWLYVRFDGAEGWAWYPLFEEPENDAYYEGLPIVDPETGRAESTATPEPPTPTPTPTETPIPWTEIRAEMKKVLCSPSEVWVMLSITGAEELEKYFHFEVNGESVENFLTYPDYAVLQGRSSFGQSEVIGYIEVGVGDQTHRIDPAGAPLINLSNKVNCPGGSR